MYKVSKTGSKDVLQTTKELTYRGDGFPGKITFENQSFLFFSIEHIPKSFKFAF